jgi:uncharacterized protein
MNATRLYQLRWIAIYLPIWLSAVVAFFWIANAYMPQPPSTVAISASREGGMYYAHAQHYAKLLKERGIELRILESAGSGENLARLRKAQPEAQFAFVQGGYALSEAMDVDSAPVRTLANVDIEPIWVFSRFKDVESLLRLQGSRVAIGQVGSGTRVVALQMLKQVRMDEKDVQLVDMGGRETVQALKNGTLDAAILVAAASAPVIQELLVTPGVHLAILKRSAALSQRMPYLDVRFVGTGSLHAQRTQPAQDSVMLSTLASVIVREDVHPMIKRIMTDVLVKTHNVAGQLHRAGEFPHLKRLEFPSAPQARAVLRSGLPWLEENVNSFWAQTVYRLVFIGLPLAAVAALLCYAIPGYLHWRMQSSINRWYGELKFIENALQAEKPSGLELAKFRQKILSIGNQVKRSVLPKAYMKRMFMLQQHMDWVLNELTATQSR